MSEKIQYAVIAADEAEIRSQVLASALTPDYTILTASDTNEIINILNTEKYSTALLLDTTMEDNGRNVLRKMQHLGISVPVLLTAHNINVGEINEYISLGVCDFIEKPYVPGLLSLRVANAAELFMLRRSLALHNKEEKYDDTVGTIDALTTLPNRVALIARLNQLIANAPQNFECAFLLVDIDRFKKVNDMLGHQTGDYLLAEIGQELRSCTRVGDIVARIGGDEFVVVIPGVSSRSLLRRRSEQICLSFSRQIGDNINISSSIGIAVYPHDGKTFSELYRHADIALYSAKSSGRNQVTFFEPHMSERPCLMIQDPKSSEACESESSAEADPYDDIICALKPCGMEPDVALTRFVGNRALFVRFVLKLASFDLPDYLKKAVERGDWRAVGETALSIKSAAANLTLPELYETASKLYAVVRSKDHVSAVELVDILIVTYSRFKEAVGNIA